MNPLTNKILLSTICFLLFISHSGLANKNKRYQTQNTPAILKEYKQVKQLKTKSGQLLGYIYVKENKKYTNGVLSALLVVRQTGDITDILYRADDKGFVDAKGKLELKNETKGYYGFKLGTKPTGSEDWFDIEFVDSKGIPFSDDNNFIVRWNAGAKAFKYDPAP